MKTIINILLAAVIAGFTFSCADILDNGENYEKEYIVKMMSPADSLKCLACSGGDFGNLKIMSTYTIYLKIVNKSDTHSIKVYSIKQKNTTGLFTYKYPHGFPFTIEPGEDTEMSEKISAKFHADVLNTGFYYDTLIINNDESFYLPLKVKVRY